MSQRTTNTFDGKNRPVLVVIGWDRPLHGYFMNVLLADSSVADPVLFTSLHARELPVDLAMYRQALDKLGIVLPEEMWADLEQDRPNNVGNAFKQYGELLSHQAH